MNEIKLWGLYTDERNQQKLHIAAGWTTAIALSPPRLPTSSVASRKKTPEAEDDAG